MADDSRVIDALLAAGTVILFFSGVVWLAHRVVTWARRRAKRAYILGAALAPFMGLGNVADPDFRVVQEAKRLKNREDDHPGDPPDPEAETIVVPASTAAERHEQFARPKEVNVTALKASRPAIVWMISLLFGIVAALAALAVSWLLLSDVESLSAGARRVRESVSPIEWVSLYAMSVLLLTSMVALLRLRKSSVWLFAVYLALGMGLTLSATLFQGQRPYFDARITLFVGLPVAVLALLCMLRLRGRRVLA